MAQLMTDSEPENVIAMRGVTRETEEKRRLREAADSGIVSIESMADYKARTSPGSPAAM